MFHLFLHRSKKSELPSGCSEASRGGPLHLASWFVWCQACRHGGHAGHIFNWFYGGGKSSSGSFGGDPLLSSELIECPVNGCSCHCAGLDASIPVPRQPFCQPPEFLPNDGGAGSLLNRMQDLQLLQAYSDQRDNIIGRMGVSMVMGGQSSRPTTGGGIQRNRREIVDPVLLLASMGSLRSGRIEN